ncbi:MAG: hypothetical protein IJ630_06800, partial [Treponema sp.]|nr:hypothetical protein [Treponema sp.]
MKRKLLTGLLLINSCLSFVFARGAQELLESGHWVYDSLTAISLEAKVLNFSGTAPLTIKQVQLYLDEIDYDSLSDVGRE